MSYCGIRGSRTGIVCADCFTAINKAFQNVRNDDEAALFGFDPYGRVYIHETTHQSIRWVWQQLVAAHAPGPGGSVPAGHGGPPPFGFTLPHLGPSEDIAQHVQIPEPRSIVGNCGMIRRYCGALCSQTMRLLTPSI